MGVAEICVGGESPKQALIRREKGPLYGKKVRISVS